MPQTDKRKMAAAGVLLLIPIVALMWVPLYARETPKLFDFPFFIWYQFAWVFLCSAMTWTAFKLTLSARAAAHRTTSERAAARRMAASDGINAVAFTVLVALFLLVTVLGFMASRFRRADDLNTLDEWGLGGRKFGTWVTWFLLGGDLYTAYTFVAVPAAMYATGAVTGFFAVPYTIVLYPIIFVFMARLWSVSHRHGYVTPADFVRGRYDDRALSLAVAVTGFLATMPYIALQLVGIQAVLEVAGIGGGDNWVVKDLPLFVAFALLAAYTYSSGLRAPALIAFVKDILIYLVIIVAIVYLPGAGRRLGQHLQLRAGEDGDHQRGHRSADRRVHPRPGAVLGLRHPRARLGARAVHVSALDHRDPVVREPQHDPPQRGHPAGVLLRARVCWPCSAGSPSRPAPSPVGGDGEPNAQLVIPQLFEDMFPSWFAGVAFAAIAIGALVPAAIMSIAAANTFTRNIYKEWINKDATPAQEAKVSKLASLVVKAFALVFVLDPRQAERDQLPAAGRDLDPADLPVDRVQPLHALVPPQGAAGGLGGRHGLRHRRGLQGGQPDHRALRRLAAGDPGHRRPRLHRDVGLRDQHAGGRAS